MVHTIRVFDVLMESVWSCLLIWDQMTVNKLLAISFILKNGKGVFIIHGEIFNMPNISALACLETKLLLA